MFGKKKNIIKVCHYEGLHDFAQDYPCEIEITEDNLIIRRIKPATEVTLPKSKIIKFEAMEEPRFMLKYHNDYARTDKGFKKYYLVITYVSENIEKYLAFWGTSFEYGKFIDLEHTEINTSSNYTL